MTALRAQSDRTQAPPSSRATRSRMGRSRLEFGPRETSRRAALFLWGQFGRHDLAQMSRDSPAAAIPQCGKLEDPDPSTA
jgi:hypothetical protein